MRSKTILFSAALLSAWLAAPAPTVAGVTGLAEKIVVVQQHWAHVNYELPKDQRGAAYTALEGSEDALIKAYPGRPEPLIWKAITLSTHAGTSGGFSALRMVREARDLLLAAQKIDPEAMDGSIYTSLGSLYYKVPGWPLGFGDDDKAERLLHAALKVNPAGIDPNYFYGEFLYQHGRYRESLEALRRALAAPPRLNRPVADRGRRNEARVLMAKVQARLAD